MKRPTRRLRAATGLAGATVLMMLSLSGCQTSPGAAAVVGNQTVSVDQLRGVYTRSLTTTCGKQYAGTPLVLQRLTLTNLVRAKLLAQLADSLGVQVTQADVNAQIASLSDHFGFRQALEEQEAASSAIAPQDLPMGVREQLLDDEVADALTKNIPTSDAQLRAFYRQHQQQYLSGHVRAIVVPDQATAQSLAAQVKANPGSFSTLLQQQVQKESQAGHQLNNPESIQRGGYIGVIPLGSLQQAGYPTSPGSVFAVQGPNGWYVFDIVDNQSFSDLKQTVRRDLLNTQRQQALSAALQRQAAKTDVHVNPRFGTWNAKAEAVAPPSGGPVAVSSQQTVTSLQCQTQG